MWCPWPLGIKQKLISKLWFHKIIEIGEWLVFEQSHEITPIENSKPDKRAKHKWVLVKEAYAVRNAIY